MDWRAITTGWVDDGLILPEQQEPLIARLEAVRPALALPMGALMTALVAPASWLMVGSVLALLAAVVDPPRFAYDIVLAGSSALLLLAGAVLRFAPSLRPVGRGLLAASVPVATWAVGSVLESTGSLQEGALLSLIAVPPLIGWVAGLVENSRAVTATSALTAIPAVWIAILGLEGPLGDWWAGEVLPGVVSLGCLVGIVGTAGFGFALPQRSMAAQVGVPTLVYLGVSLLFLPEIYFGPAWAAVGVNSPYMLEKELFMLAFGVFTLVVGVAARSAFTLVPGVLTLAGATVALAVEMGSYIGGAIALGLVSVALFAGTMALWVVPTLVRTRAVGHTQGASVDEHGVVEG